ncbi:MAG: inorganic phosphate transporter, partial [Dyella sp.]
MSMVLLVVLIALVFTYINGFHDTANSIATVVATKVLTPGQAVLLAAGTNLLGALWGTAVAATIAKGLLTIDVSSALLICALLAATIWNLITWWLGLPSSSSHALVGALVGAAIAASADRFSAVIWSAGGAHWWSGNGVIPKVVVPMVVSPLAGFVIGFALMGALYALLGWLANRRGRLR